MWPVPDLEIRAPSDADARMRGKTRLVAFSVKNHHETLNAGNCPGIEHITGGDPALCPRPVPLSKREDAFLAPLMQIVRAFDTNAIFGRVEQNVLTALHNHAGVFTTLDPAFVVPGFQVARPSHAYTGLLDFAETPPFARLVLVGDEAGIDHARHFFLRHVGTHKRMQFRFIPMFEVWTTHEP